MLRSNITDLRLQHERSLTKEGKEKGHFNNVNVGDSFIKLCMRKRPWLGLKLKNIFP